MQPLVATRQARVVLDPKYFGLNVNILRQLRNFRYRGLVIGVVCAAICLAFNQTTVFRNLENWSLDLCFIVRDRFRDSDDQSKDIVIVALDDGWYRSFRKPKMYITPELAKVVDKIQRGGAKAIGIDVYISDAVEADEGLQAGKAGDAFTLGKIRSLKDYVDDHGVVRNRCPIVLPELFLRPDTVSTADSIAADQEPATDQPSPYWFPVRQWKEVNILANIKTNVEFGISPDATSAYETLALFEDPWYAMGFVNIDPDEDSVERRRTLCFPMNILGETHLEPSLALAVFASATALDETFLKTLSTTDGNWSVPTKEGKMLINYGGAEGYFQTVPFLDAYDAEEGTQSIDWKDKIVLIGETYSTSPDRRPTPFNNQSLTCILLGNPVPWMPGVEIHAHTIQTLLDRKFITTPLFLKTPLLLFVWGALLGTILMKVNLESGLLITFIHHWFWKVVCIAAFIWLGWQIEMIAVLALGILLFAVAFALRWRWIRRMMGMVKSEAVAQALEEDPSKLDLKGEERELTILFSDIRNFTTYSESHSARDVVTLLNEYFAIVVPVIEKHNGVVNQYMGDGVMVMFGAPRKQIDHATNALWAAVEMVANVHKNKERWARLDAADLRIGVGIHTGTCVVGTVGSPNRLDYTAIGDTTNTAARIEAGNKELGTEILASAATIARLPAQSNGLRDLVGQGQPLRVKGKTTVLEVHEIFLPGQIKLQGVAPIAT